MLEMLDKLLNSALGAAKESYLHTQRYRYIFSKRAMATITKLFKDVENAYKDKLSASETVGRALKLFKHTDTLVEMELEKVADQLRSIRN